MPVNTQHPNYQKNKYKWELVRDIMTDDVKKHLIPPEFGKGRRVTLRNEAYIRRAIFYNYTVNTNLGLIGTAMRNDGKTELPTQMEYMEKNATDNGLSLDQLARAGMSEINQTGRWIIYADYPAVALGLSQEEVSTLDLNPLIYARPAEDLINWYVDASSGKKILKCAVIQECINIMKPDFTWAFMQQYRVFALDQDGYYFQQLLDQNDVPLTDPFYPTMNGAIMTFIPLVMVGSENNDDVVDESPLFPIANVNIGHYRNSGSYEDNLDAHGQGTLAITSSLNASQWQEMNQGRPLVMGSREGYFLGESGSMELCQLGANQEAANAMRQKEEQMVMMGAHLIMPAAGVQPVETTRMQMGAQLSRLDSIVSNIEDGILQVLKWCAGFKGADPDDIVYELNHEFIPDSADPLLIQQIAATWQMGGIPHSTLLDYYRKVSLLPRDSTDEEIIEEIGKESPLGAGVGFNTAPQNSNNSFVPVNDGENNND